MIGCMGARRRTDDKKRVAVVYNHVGEDEYEHLRTIDPATLDFTPEYPIHVATVREEYRAIAQALSATGFRTREINLEDNLRRLLDIGSRNRPDVVFNLTEHFRDDPTLESAVAGLLDLFALPYTGYDVPHKYPRQKASRSTGYALWPRGRLVGIEAEERGAFSTVALLAPGRHLRVNALIKRAGQLRVEAAHLSGEAVPGREFGNSIPLFGDCLGAPVTWVGHDDLGVAPGEPVILRFRLESACIYYVDFE